VELAVRLEAVGTRVLARTRDQRLAALDADHGGAAARDRQAEVAQAAEQVGDALARPRIEQLHRAPDQQAVDVHVDLGEVGRPEVHAHVELGQGVGEPRAVLRLQRRRGVRPAGLGPHLDAVGVGEGGQRGFVLRAERQQVAEHEGGRGVAHRDLDLRHAVGDRQLRNQRV